MMFTVPSTLNFGERLSPTGLGPAPRPRALATYNDRPSALTAHAARPPAGRNVADEIAPCLPLSLITPMRVHAGFRDVEEVSVRTQREADRLHALQRAVLTSQQRQPDATRVPR